MRGDDDRHAFVGEGTDARPESLPRRGIGSARGLVEKEDVRLVQERRRHREALLDAERQRARRRAPPARKAEFGGGPIEAFREPCPGKSVGAAEERQILRKRQIAVKRELLRDEADAPPRLSGRVSQIDAPDGDASAGRRVESAEHAEGRRLARAVRAKETENLASPDGE